MRFDQNVEYKRRTGAYPLRDFNKICREFVPHFRMHWLLKFRYICSRGYGFMGVLSWWCRVSANSSIPRSGKTMHQTSKSFKGARTCSRSSITVPSLSPAAVTAKNIEFFCLSVRHASVNAVLSVRQVAPVVLREFYYLFPLKIVVRNFT